MKNDLFSIGERACHSGLSVKAMRYYDRVGLLHPAVTDQTTGFRYYSYEQVATGDAEAARVMMSARSKPQEVIKEVEERKMS